jgi:hypothetical protein
MHARAALRWSLVLFALSFASCQFDASVPLGARVRCEADSECPEGGQCDSEFRFCVAAKSR